MTKTAKNTETAKIENLPFEEALKRLEGIVESMESGELPLESLLARYDEGARLARVCQTRLSDAELRIRKLEQDANGEPVLKPLAETESDAP